MNAYRAERKHHAGASRINHEMSTIQQMLKRAGRWAEIASWYEPLPLPKTGPGVALEVEQEERLFKVASQKKRWMVAYCCALITANTTAGPEEIRKLQLKDVCLRDRMIHVREGAKNRFRERDLDLNDDAFWAVQRLMERAGKMGATEPEHYLLPHRAESKGAKPDPTRPANSWYKAWYALRKAAGLPRLRRYDLRHHAVTRLLEDPEVSERTVIDIAGHVSKQMLSRYSHIRAKARQSALERLNNRRAPAPVTLEIVENVAKTHK